MSGPLARRDLLRRGAFLAGTVASGVLLARCAPGQSPQAPPSATSGAGATPTGPRALDRLTLSWWTDVGYPSPFAFSALGPGGIVRVSLLFDTLTWKDGRGIIPLRPGVRWHDGQALTAGDVAFSLTYEEAFDWLTRLAARLLGTPTAFVSLVDAERQVFKSRVLPPELGVIRELPLDYSFCQHTLDSRQPLILHDLRGLHGAKTASGAGKRAMPPRGHTRG